MVLMNRSLDEDHFPVFSIRVRQECFHLVDVLPAHETLGVDKHDWLFWSQRFILHGEQPAVQHHALLEPLVLCQGHHGGGSSIGVA